MIFPFSLMCTRISSIPNNVSKPGISNNMSKPKNSVSLVFLDF